MNKTHQHETQNIKGIKNLFTCCGYVLRQRKERKTWIVHIVKVVLYIESVV